MQCRICKSKNRLAIHKFCSKTCYWKSLEGVKGKNAPNYREVVGKSQIHKWMDVHYGKPKICEMKGCEGKSIWYDWALKKDYQYERNKKNFLRLCRSCHRRYDMNPEKKKQAISNLWWKNGTIRNIKSKLVKEDVLRIRELYKNGASGVEIAKEYGVHWTNIYLILNRKTWKKI